MNNKTKTLLTIILLLSIVVCFGNANIYGLQLYIPPAQPSHTLADYLYEIGRGAMTGVGRGIYDRYQAYLQDPDITDEELSAKLAEIRAEELREHPLGGTTGGKWLRRIPLGMVAFVCFLIYCSKRREKIGKIKTVLKLKGWGKTITMIVSMAIMLTILMIYINKLEKNRREYETRIQNANTQHIVNTLDNINLQIRLGNLK